jgi:hypothetical protein
MAKQSSILDLLRIGAAKHIPEQNLALDAFQSKASLFYGIKRFGTKESPNDFSVFLCVTSTCCSSK